MANQDLEKDSLFKEIDEELRHENYAKLWKRYGKYLVGIVFLFVASVAIYQGWEKYDENRRSEDSTLYAKAIRAITQNKIDEASVALTRLAEDGTKGYSTLARLNQAGMQVRLGDLRGGATAYLSIANDLKVDVIFRDLALVLSAMNDINNGDPKELTNRVQRLTVSSNPWRHTAKELSAIMAQKSGDQKRAKKLFEELADDVTAPAGIRARAAEMSAISGS